MPYLLLALGCLIGAYALYRFFLNANIAQIKALFLSAILLTLVVALFFMAITGRLAAALALVVAIMPVALSIWNTWQKSKGKSAGNEQITTRTEALEVLGLEDGASEKEIKAAYNKLMKKVHPDAEGSEWMAAKLNQARDLLLK